VAPFPGGRNGHKGLYGSSGWFVSKATQHPIESWKLIEYITSYDSMLGLAQAGSLAPSRLSVVTSPEYQSLTPLDPAFIQSAYPNQTTVTFFNREAEYRNEVQRLLQVMLRGQSSPPETIAAIQQLDRTILEDIVLY